MRVWSGRVWWLYGGLGAGHLGLVEEGIPTVCTRMCVCVCGVCMQ